jgi:hypothetical protein
VSGRPEATGRAADRVDGLGLPSVARRVAAHRARRAHGIRRLRDEADSVWGALEGRMGIDRPQDWRRTCARAADDYERGRFLIERLGAERVMDPLTTATIWRLRQKMIADHGATTAAETMLIDLAVVNYFTALKIQALIGNAVVTTEHEFFGDDGPRVRWRKIHGREAAEALSVEHTVERLVLVLMPLFERANRGMIRNLTALRDLRQPAPSPVTIGQAGQVNVGQQQVNVGRDGA